MHPYRVIVLICIAFVGYGVFRRYRETKERLTDDDFGDIEESDALQKLSKKTIFFAGTILYSYDPVSSNRSSTHSARSNRSSARSSARY